MIRLADPANLLGCKKLDVFTARPFKPDEAGVSDEVAAKVARKAKSKVAIKAKKIVRSKAAVARNKSVSRSASKRRI